MIDYFHKKVCHQGRHLTAGEIRSNGYHILNLKSAIRRFLFTFIQCKKLRGLNSTQLMANLPKARIEEDPPFANSGLDVFGPFIVNNGKHTRRTSGEKKVWVAIFVCLVSRAVHLEFISALDTNAFRNALQTFIAIRRTPKIIRSDNGTNIVSTKSQVFNTLRNNLERQNIEWLFNPSCASHFGRTYERKIGSIRRIMEGCFLLIERRKLSYDELNTLLHESCAIVSSLTPRCMMSHVTPMTQHRYRRLTTYLQRIAQSSSLGHVP